MSSINNLLNSNQYAAKTLWNLSLSNGNSTNGSSSASGLLGIIKSNLAQKANNKNSAQISALENKIGDLTNKLGKLDGYKSKLAQLASTAEDLTDLRSKIKINQTNSDFITSNVSVSGNGIGLKNVNGTLQEGLYGMKVSYANGSGPSSLVSKSGAISSDDVNSITNANILNTKISEFNGYKKKSSGIETVTIKNGNKTASVQVTNDTTVSNFLNSINNSNIGIAASYDSNDGRIKFVTDNSVENLQITSDGVENSNTLNVLKLDTVYRSDEQGAFSSNLQINRPTNFGDLGYDGNIQYLNKLSFDVQADTTYGDIISGTYLEENSTYDGVTIQYNENNFVMTSNTIKAFSGYSDGKRNLYNRLGVNNSSDLNIKSKYYLSSVSVVGKINMEDLDTVVNYEGTLSYSNYDKTETSINITSGMTKKDVLLGLGLITEEDISSNTSGYIEVDFVKKGIRYVDDSIDNIFNEYTITDQAKPIDIGGPIAIYETSEVEANDYLIRLVSNKQNITTGTFIISDVDGSNQQTFTIYEDTTFEQLQNFLSTNGVTINENGTFQAENKIFDGTSNLKDMFNPDSITSNIEFDRILPSDTTLGEENSASLNFVRKKNFGDVGYNGTINYGSDISIDIQTDATYGDIIIGTYRSSAGSQENFSVQYNENSLVMKSDNIEPFAAAQSGTAYRVKHSLIANNSTSDLANKYDVSNVTLVGKININDLQKTTSWGQFTEFYYDMNGVEHSFQGTADTTYGEILLGLGLITQEDISNNTSGYIEVDFSNVRSIGISVANLFEEFTLTAQAKSGEEAPATLGVTSDIQSDDKLVNLISNNQNITTGTFVISNADGSNQQTFNITNETTFADFQNFLTTNGATINEDGTFQVGNKAFDGTSNLKDLFETAIYLSNAKLDKNLTALGLSADSSFSINGTSIQLNTDDRLEDLISKINQVQNDVVASFDKTTNQITLTSVDPLKKINIIGSDQTSNLFLEKLGFVKQNEAGVFETEGKSPVLNVELTKDGEVLSNQTVLAANDGKYTYNYEQTDENGNQNASISFNINSIGDFSFSILNTLNNSDKQISESMNNIISSINSEIEVTNNKAIKDFVKAFNGVASQAADILKLSSNTTSYSDKSAINSFVQKLNSTITQISGKLGYEVGLSFEYNASTNTSSLKFDTEKFFNAIDEDSEGVTKYLSDVSKEIVSSIESFMSGSLKNISSTSNSKINQYNDKISHLKNENQKFASKLESDYKMIEQLLGQTTNQYSELFSALS